MEFIEFRHLNLGKRILAAQDVCEQIDLMAGRPFVYALQEMNLNQHKKVVGITPESQLLYNRTGNRPRSAIFVGKKCTAESGTSRVNPAGNCHKKPLMRSKTCQAKNVQFINCWCAMDKSTPIWVRATVFGKTPFAQVSMANRERVRHKVGEVLVHKVGEHTFHLVISDTKKCFENIISMQPCNGLISDWVRRTAMFAGCGQ